MNEVIWNFYHLALTAVFKSGPQNLRTSYVFLVLSLLIYLFIDATLLSVTSNTSWLVMIALSALKVGIAGLIIWYWLDWNKARERFHATIIALLILGATAQLLKIPFFPISADQPWMVIPPSIILLWSFATFIYILKQTLDKPYMEIFLLLVIINTVSYSLATTTIVVLTGNSIVVKTVQ